ncbi:MAG: DEAD/DEAH box helicase [Actinobacteria bacterium]|nr:DEAD/DEAH box helicase [Actinomycetota bacterium]
MSSATPSHAPMPSDPDVPTFAELGLPNALVSALARKGITSPFPIQAATMVDALAGRDVLGRAQTGSGKTLAFGLPMLARLAHKKAQAKHPLALVLVPTRELAMQVNDTLAPLAHAVGLDVRLIAGGMPYGKQTEALRRGVQILVATPGRLSDLIEQGACSLSDVELAVLDEADHMADMGFLPAVSELLDQVAPGGQRLLFSATLDNGVDKLVRRYLNNPVTHSMQSASASVSTMDHHLLLVHPDDKAAVTAEIAAREGRTIMFVRTKHGADRLATTLARQGVSAGSLHGGKTQAARTRALDAFREGRTPVLVATDVAARGIHVDDISLVVHVDPPNEHKDYLHRAGRTARAGESGTVVTLVLPHQQREVDALTNRAGVKPERTKVRPGNAVLVEVTGARTPSGIPIIAAKEDAAPKRGSRPPRSGGGGGSYKGKGGSSSGRAASTSQGHASRRPR